MKNLIVYYSYEGNTEELVKGMQDGIKADVLKLIPKKEKKTKSLFRFVWGGMQVYMTKKLELEEYNIDLSKYDNIFIGSPCWFGTYAPPINTFLSENKIVSKIDFVYPIKNGIEEAKTKAKNWALTCLKIK